MVGTGYAATQLPKNSVGPKQLKKNAVTAAKIKNNAVTAAKVKDGSLTGKDIDLAKLGTVPSATHASAADTASALAPLEATHLVGAPGQPPFENGSSQAVEAGINLPAVGFYKDHEGIVHLTGVVKTGPERSTIFTLPPGFRPAAGTVMVVNVYCEAVGGACETDSPAGNEERYVRLLIAGSSSTVEGTSVDGRVIARPGVVVSLDAVTFRAES